ncbi:sulfite oxidase [Bradyrhizobium sp. Ash2021]|uniref:sulfite oxidase n=1 Tax=Bradyrhizobium sp. Ash2021 TaxID=2954771 RepID=UPI0028163E09|nr:sulfite oxidase [Bradyrhizobium sp. Ash2021]WMT77471.1 sulfite oxidase [Bradyrhizobium sp. Ash2021]
MDMKTDNWSGTATRPVGLIIRQKGPNNLEMPFDQLGDFITPSELFYIRSHFPTPELDPLAYRLSISGAVRNELSLSYADIRAMPSRTCVATLECAGNSRVFMVPPVPGAQWQLGAVGNAEWTGVPLSILLERAGLADEVCELVLEGADRGVPKEEPKPPGPISYARSIPRTKAMESDVLIAYQMNGQDLTPDHGYPLRAIVPGHYGMASVKWLTDIVATTQPFQGYWQTSDYGYWDDSEGTPVRRPLAEMKLKSQIARPRVYETLEPNRSYTIFGAAWAGDTDVAEIWISLDGGASWVQGDFVDPINRHAWRRWKYDWITPAQPGGYTLLARAVGADQRGQPDAHNPNFGSYVIDHPLPIEVFVAAV